MLGAVSNVRYTEHVFHDKDVCSAGRGGGGYRGLSTSESC